MKRFVFSDKYFSMRVFDSVRQIWNNFNKHHGFLWATSLTYTTLFALVPLLAVALSLFKAFGGFEDIQENILLPFVSEILDPTNKIKVMQYIQGFVDKINAGALGLIGTTVFILTFVPLFLGMETAINTIWGKVDDRSIWNKFVTYWAITTLGPVAIVLTISVVSFFEDFIPGMHLLQSLKPMMVIYLIFGLFLINKLVPNTEVGNLPAFIGALAGGIAWIIANLGYQTYMGYATASFNIYGSLGTIPVFLLWIYINWIIVLACVEVCRFAQHPELDTLNGGSTPVRYFTCALDLLRVLYTGIQRGTYFTESQLRNQLAFPPEITSAIIADLRESRILIIKGNLILPSKGASEVSVADIATIFFGNVSEKLLRSLKIDVSGLKGMTLDDLER